MRSVGQGIHRRQCRFMLPRETIDLRQFAADCKRGLSNPCAKNSRVCRSQLQQIEQASLKDNLFQTNQQLSTRCAERGCTRGRVWIPHQFDQRRRVSKGRGAAASAPFSARRARPRGLGNGRKGSRGRMNGRGERIRTSGLYVPNVALYQAKLHPDAAVAVQASL